MSPISSLCAASVQSRPESRGRDRSNQVPQFACLLGYVAKWYLFAAASAALSGINCDVRRETILIAITMQQLKIRSIQMHLQADFARLFRRRVPRLYARARNGVHSDFRIQGTDCIILSSFRDSLGHSSRLWWMWKPTQALHCLPYL